MGHKLVKLGKRKESEFQVAKARITLGLRRGYKSRKVYTPEEVKAFILKLSLKDFSNGIRPLSFLFSKGELVYAREKELVSEPTLLLTTLNNPMYAESYPPSQKSSEQFRERIIHLARRLGEHFHQQRVYIDFFENTMSVSQEVIVSAKKAVSHSPK